MHADLEPGDAVTRGGITRDVDRRIQRGPHVATDKLGLHHAVITCIKGRCYAGAIIKTGSHSRDVEGVPLTGDLNASQRHIAVGDVLVIGDRPEAKGLAGWVDILELISVRERVHQVFRVRAADAHSRLQRSDRNAIASIDVGEERRLSDRELVDQVGLVDRQELRAILYGGKQRELVHADVHRVVIDAELALVAQAWAGTETSGVPIIARVERVLGGIAGRRTVDHQVGMRLGSEVGGDGLEVERVARCIVDTVGIAHQLTAEERDARLIEELAHAHRVLKHVRGNFQQVAVHEVAVLSTSSTARLMIWNSTFGFPAIEASWPAHSAISGGRTKTPSRLPDCSAIRPAKLCRMPPSFTRGPRTAELSAAESLGAFCLAAFSLAELFLPTLWLPTA